MVVRGGRVEIEGGEVGCHWSSCAKLIRLLGRNGVCKGGLARGALQVVVVARLGKVATGSIVGCRAQGHCAFARAGGVGVGTAKPEGRSERERLVTAIGRLEH